MAVNNAFELGVSELGSALEIAEKSGSNGKHIGKEPYIEVKQEQNIETKPNAIPAEDHKFKEPLKLQHVETNDNFKKPQIIFGPRRGVKGITSMFHKLKQKEKLGENDSKELPETSKEIVEKFDVIPVECELENNPDIKSTTVKPSSAQQECPYKEPAWKGLPEKSYVFEELKSGVIQGEIDLTNRSCTIFGRLESCDVVMAHPTISRYHAVLQYRAEKGDEEKGFYLYDLGSTHGTFLNKNRLKPKHYVRVKVGHVIKFGCSTRLFLLQGPAEDEEEESEFTITELKEKRKKELEEREINEVDKRLKYEMEEEKRLKALEERGIDWGMGEDADEETDMTENPFAVTTNEEMYIDDPKKTLRGWFEREGEELNYEVEQAEKRSFVCKIVLPLDNGSGRDVVVECTGKSKKEAVVQAALEACRHIDRQGLLRQSHHESRKRQTKNWEENDYYDSDDDSFLDRTGNIEAKREKRMRKMGKIKDIPETYESLMEKHKIIVEQLQEAELKWQNLTCQNLKVKEDNEEIDALDQFMNNLQDKCPNKMEIKLCKQEIRNLKEQEEKLRLLINIAKPASMPELKPVEIKPKSKRVLKDNVNQSDGDSGTDANNLIYDFQSDNTLEEKECKLDHSSIPDTKKIGPTLPTKEDLKEIEKKRKRGRQRSAQKMQKTSDLSEDFEEDYNNCVWTPPKGQTGDGRTSLNDKLGY